MSTNKSNKPELRFKGFSDDWEQRKLSEITTIHARIGWQNLRTSEFLDDGDYYLITGTDIVEGRIDFSNCHYVAKGRYDQDKNIQINNGSILITKDGTLGKVAYVSGLNKPATLNAGVFNVVIKADDIDGTYLYHYIDGPFLMDYVSKRATGGTIKHLNQSILVDFPVVLPSYEEQKKIGETLQGLDSLITLHQRKCDNLKIIKKSMLDNLFPKIGEKVPKWRFKGFNNDWEQRKLGDMTVELTEYETLKSGYPLLTSSRTGLMFQKDFRDKASTDNNSTKFSIVPYGKCTYRHMSDDNIFHFNINTIAENGLVSKEYPVFDANDNYNLKFIVDYLNNSKEFVRFCTQRKLGGTRTRLYYKNLCDFKMYVPQLEEQNIIAQHLKLLDNLITLHQSEVERLKKAKQFFLDKMFI